MVFSPSRSSIRFVCTSLHKICCARAHGFSHRYTGAIMSVDAERPNKECYLGESTAHWFAITLQCKCDRLTTALHIRLTCKIQRQLRLIQTEAGANCKPISREATNQITWFSFIFNFISTQCIIKVSYMNIRQDTIVDRNFIRNTILNLRCF